MSRPDINLIYDLIKGRKSRFIYGERDGRPYIYPRPSPEEESPAKQEAQRKFRRGAAYARAVMADPALRAPYEVIATRREDSLYRVILTDYLKGPKVLVIDLSAFGGFVGQPIRIEAEDDCEVMSLTVAIRAADDTLLEEGAAVYDAVSLKWVYAAAAAHPTGNPITITATAVDRPGNKGSKTEGWGPLPSE